MKNLVYNCMQFKFNWHSIRIFLDIFSISMSGRSNSKGSNSGWNFVCFCPQETAIWNACPTKN